MVKRTDILLIVIAGISLLMAGCVSDELTSEQIVEQMREHKNDVQECTYTMVWADTMLNETVVIDFAYKTPGMIRMEYKEPAEFAGKLEVSNGTYTWMYDPASNTVWAGAVPADARMNESLNGMFIEGLLDTCTIEAQGRAVADGRACYVVTATQKDVDVFEVSMRLWFDRATWMLLKEATQNQNGEVVMQMEYRDVQLDIDIPDSTFEFEVPEGATVESMDRATAPQEMTLEEAQAEVTFEIKEPDHLPPGYETDIIIMAVPIWESDKGVIITYTNATEEDPISAQLTTIQLIESAYNESTERPVPEGVETVRINGRDCTITTFRARVGETRVLQWLLKWDDGECDFVLAGALDREAMIEIAKSI
ncbi:MAG: DUF4367 domain-containing protein [Methanosarcinales archaeon]|nr:DUF4367 domain-containing protein [Methanosarcinales archaeon]